MPGRYGTDTPKPPLRDESRRYGTRKPPLRNPKAAATEPQSRRYGTPKPPLRNQSRRFVDHGLGTCDLFRSEVLFL
jgi:hypothetical protein